MVMVLLRGLTGEKTALDLVLTGRVLSADESQRMGIVSRVLAEAELEQATMKLAAELAQSSASALALTKQLFYQLEGDTLGAGIARGARVNAVARSTPDFREAIARFLQK